MAIKQKTVYETTDGKSFSDEMDAIAHQARVDAFEHAHNQEACYGQFEFMDENEFADFVLKYADMIRKKSAEEMWR